MISKLSTKLQCHTTQIAFYLLLTARERRPAHELGYQPGMLVVEACLYPRSQMRTLLCIKHAKNSRGKFTEFVFNNFSLANKAELYASWAKFAGNFRPCPLQNLGKHLQNLPSP